jgi:hypothetical protein
MKHSVSKNEYGLGAPGRRSAHEFVKIPADGQSKIRVSGGGGAKTACARAEVRHHT